MSLHLVNGYAGTSHVTANDARYENASMVGTGVSITNFLDKLGYTLVSNNAITIGRGVGFVDGAEFELSASEDVTINNGTVGYYRKDLICLEYERNISSGVESLKLVVVEGEPSTTSALDPDIYDGSILDGDSIVDFPIYRVNLNGINIASIDKLFTPHDSLMELIQANSARISSVSGKLGDQVTYSLSGTKLTITTKS